MPQDLAAFVDEHLCDLDSSIELEVVLLPYRDAESPRGQDES